MNNIFSDKLKDIIDEVSQIKKFTENKLRNSPAGSLEVNKERGVLRYYQVSSDSRVYEKYLGEQDIETVRSLEEKLYNQKLLKTVEKELKELMSILKKLEKLPDYNSVFLTIPHEKRHLIEPIRICKEATPIEFSHNKAKIFKQIESTLITQDGEKVRSKSELIIADRLKAAKIPYLYEYPLRMRDKDTGRLFICYPDFKVLNKRTGRQYYWEHFGMMDNTEYCKTCQSKIKTYAENGYYPGESLIITIESSQYPINTGYIDLLISKYLL